MKKIIIALLGVVLVTIFITSIVFANLPGAGWWSSLFVQNIGGAEGFVQMVAYDSKSENTYDSDSFTFNYGQALAYNPGVVPNYNSGGAYIGFLQNLPTGFEGSVVISGNVQMAAVSEVANYNNGLVGGNGTACARYQGVSQTSNVLMMPKIKNNFSGNTTTLYVQAAGANASVTAAYKMNDGGVYEQMVLIGANKMFIFDPTMAGVPSTGCGNNANTSPCYGSVTFTSSTPIAATIVEHPHSGSPAGFSLSTRVQTPEEGDIKLYHPAVKNNYFGRMDASAAVINLGQYPTLVRITLTVTNVSPGSTAKVGQIYVDEMVFQPGEALVFTRWQNNLGGMPAGTYAAAVIESVGYGGHPPQLLSSTTNDKKYLPDLPGNYGINLYAGYPDKNATTKLAGPTLLEFSNNLTGAVTIQNVGDAPTKIYYTYYEYGTSNVYRFETKSMLAVGAAVNTYGISKETNGVKFNIIEGFSNFSELGNKQFSVIASADQPIIGLVAENSPKDVRDMCNYEMINVTP